jgi:hypothetical protein
MKTESPHLKKWGFFLSEEFFGRRRISNLIGIVLHGGQKTDSEI